MVIAALGAGGAERVASILANAWAGEGIQVTLLTLDDGSISPFYRLDTRVRLTALGVAGDSRGWGEALFNNLRRLQRLRAAVASSAPDVVISLLTETNVLTLIASVGVRAPVVACEHTDPFGCPVGRVWGFLRRLTYRRAKRVVVLSERARSFFGRGVRTEVIPNPVILPAAYATAASLRDSRNIVAMGRLAPEKRFDMLLRAFAQIAERYPDWSLEILGDGPQRGALEKLRGDLGLERRVRLPGTSREPQTELLRSAMFVSSSALEGFPMAICEAMACGLPVVAAEYHEGIRELMHDGIDGIIVSGDAAALAAAIERLIRDSDERARLGAAARKITLRYSPESVQRRWDILFGEVAVQQ
jgi:GalNAc-alpha-(1->4)-GalNAc-alpha-(1->3)-diNAcBac-PP-undecaprenol alpha-1,4-N-acetyl-D-galactosaminyltransferase